jgi:N-acetyl-gamma-glutamyl-phosphate reductase
MHAYDVNFVFTPHLVPMVRGIFATLYVTKLEVSTDLANLYKQRYKDEAFVRVLDEGVLPETKFVRASNQCMLSVSRPYDGDTAVVLSVIDNLVKGAAGQAVQNMNLMFNIEETTGLANPGLFP